MDTITVTGKPLASSWWGKAWHKNLESYSDYSNRLPRARNYLRQGHVSVLKIEKGIVRAKVRGSRRTPYRVEIKIRPLDKRGSEKIILAIHQRIENLEALVQGTFPPEMGELLTNKELGFFPSPQGIEFSCSCPDWASMCRHVGAVLYGIGAKLDENPLLFFTLRGIDSQAFLKKTIVERIYRLLEHAYSPSPRVIPPKDLAALFGSDK